MAKTLRLSDRAAFLIVGNGIQSLSAMVTVMVLARLLSQGDYGSYRQVWLAYNVAAPFLMLGIPASVLYFLPRLEPPHRRAFVSQTVLLLLALGVVFAAGLYLAAPLVAARFRNPGLAHLLRAFAPYTVAAFPLAFVPNSLVALNRHRLASLLTGAFALSLMAVVVGVALATTRLLPTVAAIPLVAAGQLLVGVAAIRSGWWGPRPWCDAKLLRTQLAYSIPIGIAGLAGTVGRQIGQALVSMSYPRDQYAVYAVGAFEVPLLSVMTGAVMTTLMPVLSGMAHRQETAPMLRLWHESIRKVSLVLFPLFALFFVLAPELVVLLFSAKYAASTPIFRIYLLLLPLRTTVYSSVLMAAGQTGALALGAAGFLVLVAALTWVLLGSFGLPGAAAAAVISTYALGAFYLAAVKRKLALDTRALFPWRQVNAILAFACLIGLVVWPLVLLPLGLWPRVGLVTVVYLALYLPLGRALRLLTADDLRLATGWLTLRTLRRS